MNNDLYPHWQHLCAKFTEDNDLINQCFEELIKAYNDSGRHYHNPQHLQELLNLLKKYETHLKRPDIVAFAIWYHDVVYNPLRKDNELKSAEHAKERLAKLGLSEQEVKQCYGMILATKDHVVGEFSDSDDTGYFLDMDMAILAADAERYQQYTKGVRQEYKIYPNFMYRKGRRKVLESFLAKDRIYLTEEFHEQLESKARKNIKTELATLV